MSRVLVPLAVLKGETVSPGLMNLLGTVDVTVLGYHVPPDQTSTEQARSQFGDRAKSALEDISQEFQQAGGDADYRLVFTHDRNQTVQRVADEIDARSLITTGATGDVEQLLVSLSGDVDTQEILSFVSELIANREIGVTLLAVSNRTGDVESRLKDAASHLSSEGIDVETVAKTGSAFDAITETIEGHDAVVLGEKAPSLTPLIFGDKTDQIASTTVGPVLVVRTKEQHTVDDS